MKKSVKIEVINTKTGKVLGVGNSKSHANTIAHSAVMQGKAHNLFIGFKTIK